MKIKQQCSMVRILLAASFILLSSFSEARITKIKQSLLFAPHHLGNVALLHSEEKGFWVVQKGQNHPVDDFLIDPQLQGLSSDALDAFLRDGLISIIPHDSGEFELEACHSEAGKGPAGRFAASIVRAAAYGCIASMSTTAVSSVVAAAGGGAAGGTINTGGAVLLGKTEIITPGSAVVAAFIEGSGSAAAATDATAAVIAAVGNPPAAVALVEGLAFLIEFGCQFFFKC